MQDKRYEMAELAELLIDVPASGVRRHWAGVFVLRALETRGRCRYRHGADRLGATVATRAASEALAIPLQVFSAPERALYLRLVLLIGWERISRDTGLRLKIPAVLDVLSGAAMPAELEEAAGAVVISGAEALRCSPLSGVLDQKRVPVKGLVVEIPTDGRSRMRSTLTQVDIDPVAFAVQSFHPRGWESNLRALVPWWLDKIEASRVDGAARCLLASEGESTLYRLLGLIDWTCEHPEHCLAPDVLDRGLKLHRSSLRKAAALLASAMEQHEVLEDLRENDPDQGVRNRAAKLLSPRQPGLPRFE